MTAQLHTDVANTLRSWSAPNPAQHSLREAFLGFLAARPADGLTPDATERACVAGHITASTVLLSADRQQVLLTLHPRVGRWLVLGGHLEPTDVSVQQAALRETQEESGIADIRISTEPLLLNVHPITCSLGQPTRHFDLCYQAQAAMGAQEQISAESLDLRWWPVHGLPALSDEAVRTAVAMATRC